MTDSTEHPYSPKFDPYFIAIGRVANVYSQLEFKMNDAIWELANVARSAGVCMTAQMIGPAPRNRCLLALLKFRNASSALITEFNKIGTKIEGVAARRNRYIHDPFVLNPDTGQILRMESTADKSIRYGFVNAEANDLEQLATEIDTIADEFDDLYVRAVAELPEWPRTQFEQSTGIQVRRSKPR
ncbi:MAG TPA: hypothetical protein VKG24_08260 [Pseudolabrys sp.]|nr:hypothetical protein [Pseudolabrys sp.]